jgi:hypothetical protein
LATTCIYAPIFEIKGNRIKFYTEFQLDARTSSSIPFSAKKISLFLQFFLNWRPNHLQMIHRNRLPVVAIISFAIIFITSQLIENPVQSNESGAPAGYTGSPGDNFTTCADCHSGPAETFMAGWITSNIPASGYVPGTTYTVSATLTRPGHVVGGFQVSPQNNSGNLLGTLLITDPSHTKLVGSGKYVTHTSLGTQLSGGTRTWSFDWVAPATGTGGVTFYGAFNATNNQNNQSGDTIFISTMTVQECQLPQQASPIVGPAVVCDNASYTYSIQHSPDATSYSWTLPNGWQGLSSDTFITVTTGTAGGTIIVNAINSCGGSTDRTLNVTSSTLTAAVTNTTSTNCPNGTDGTATALGSNGVGTYSYSWNTIPVQNLQTATGLSAGIYTVTITDQNNCTAQAQDSVSSPVTIVINGSSTHVACAGTNNGSVTASVSSGGTSPYSYSWNTSPVQNTQSASNLNAGTYIVTVTDGHGCTQTSSVNVPVAPVLGVTVSGTNVSCNGGSNGTMSAVPNGGAGPFSYTWNTTPVQTTATATGLPAGSYSVEITDANTCTASGLSIIFQPSPIAVNTSKSDALCFGSSTGKAYASASGGTGPYSYHWNTSPAQNNDTAFNLPVGTYIVTVTDANSCTKTSSVTISQPATAVSATTVSGTTTCFGGHDGSASVSATGGTAPYSYLWSVIPVQANDTAFNLTAGIVTVTVNDSHGCTFSTSANISSPPAIVVNTSTIPVQCNGGIDGIAAVTSSGGTGQHIYEWNTNPVQFYDTAFLLVSGTYIVTVTDDNGCTKTSSATVTEPTAITLQTSSVNASCQQGNGSASVVASGGTTPYSYAWTTVPVQHTATATGLLAGIYGITVTDAHGCNSQTYTAVSNNTGMTLNIVSVAGVSCYGDTNGTASVTVSNANGPLVYSWLPTHDSTPIVTDLPPGNVSITVIDTFGCQVSAVLAIPEPTLLVAYPHGTSVICSGDSIMLGGIPAATGGTPPYRFSWLPTGNLLYDSIANPLAFPSSTTVYTMTVTDSSACVSAVNDTIIVNSVPTPQIISSGDTLISTPAQNYQWYRNDTLIAGADDYFYIPSIDANYSVITSDSNGCHSQSAQVQVIVNTRSAVIGDLVSVFPNPPSDELYVMNNYSRKQIVATLMTIEGFVISKIQLNGGINTIDVRGISNGNYVLHIESEGMHWGKIISVVN